MPSDTANHIRRRYNLRLAWEFHDGATSISYFTDNQASGHIEYSVEITPSNLNATINQDSPTAFDINFDATPSQYVNIRITAVNVCTNETTSQSFNWTLN